MFEFLFELFFEFIVGVILEFAVELGGAVLLDLLLRGTADIFDSYRFQNAFLAWFSYLLCGGTMGGLSLLLFPHPLVHPGRFHGLSLITSPVITGFAMWFVGTELLEKGKKITRIESFGYAAVFAFGMALIRFLFTR
jgi:hypothetical protein